jgi:hypothetical protein
MPDVKLPGKQGDKLDGFNPRKLQKTSKAGSGVETAKSGE